MLLSGEIVVPKAMLMDLYSVREVRSHPRAKSVHLLLEIRNNELGPSVRCFFDHERARV